MKGWLWKKKNISAFEHLAVFARAFLAVAWMEPAVRKFVVFHFYPGLWHRSLNAFQHRAGYSPGEEEPSRDRRRINRRLRDLSRGESLFSCWPPENPRRAQVRLGNSTLRIQHPARSH